MKGALALLRVMFAVALLVGALALVTWRQSRALEVLEELDRIQRETTVADGEREELERKIEVLESRVRVVPTARERLGMHLPTASEQVFLPAESKQ
jgi:cell division protein FtsL